MQNSTRKVPHIEEREFEEKVIQSDAPTVVDFYADWCGPCRLVGPIIEALSEEYAGRVKFVKVNTDYNQRLAFKYDIMSIPTVMIFKEGRVAERVIGAVPNQVFRNKIDRVLNGR